MQPSKLLILSFFALAASTTIPPVPTPSSVTFTPLPPCTLGGDASCGTGSICTPITNCVGHCYSGSSTLTVLPTSNIPITATLTCQVGFPDACFPGSYCLPTQTCAGLCINTVIPPPATTTTLPTTPPSGITTPPTSIPSSRYGCVVNEYDSTQGCPTSSFCTPVGECGGICSTTTPPYSLGTGCQIYGTGCGPNAVCSQFAGCDGTCVPIPPTTTPKTTPTPTSTHSVPSPSGTCGWVYIPCPSGYKCVNQAGGNCGVGESGHCVPVHQGKHRFLAGRYFDAGEE